MEQREPQPPADAVGPREERRPGAAPAGPPRTAGPAPPGDGTWWSIVKHTAESKLRPRRAWRSRRPRRSARRPGRSRRAPASAGVELERREVGRAPGEQLRRAPEARADLENVVAEPEAVDRGRHQVLAHVTLPGVAVAVPVVQAVHSARILSGTAQAQLMPASDPDRTMTTEEHDLGLSHDLPRLISRRRALGLFAGGHGTAALAACGAPGGREDTTGAATAESGGSASEIPEETAGPYPGDGSNGPNVARPRAASSAATSRRASATLGRGRRAFPPTIEMTLLDVAGGGTPLAGAAVYLWHCDIDGQLLDVRRGASPARTTCAACRRATSDGKVDVQEHLPGRLLGPLAAHPLRGLREPRRRHAAGSQAARPRRSRCRKDACDAVYATDGYEQSAEQPRADLARQRHGVQRRLRQPARDGVRHGRRAASPSS